jgi:23S rRNA pseudouridine1911/1915/1917 synthase
MSLDILLQDNHLLVVDKPAGCPVVPDDSGDLSLLDLARAWIREVAQKPGNVFVGVVHRLDRPVSGIVLFARTSKAAERLSAQLREHQFKKLYLAQARGSLPRSEGEVVQWLRKDEATNTVHVLRGPAPGAKQAITRYRVRSQVGDLYELELEPVTGRSHQLRVAMASLGAPLLGDLKYGALAALPGRNIALHATLLQFKHPTLGEDVVVRSPPPWAPREEAIRGSAR